MIPAKLKPGDGVRILAPSCTLPTIEWLTPEILERAKNWFTRRRLTVSEGRYIREMDILESTSIAHRVEDLHNAFLDDSVQAIITVRGGWLSNQLLGHLDYDLIRAHPKILCGFSDITALGNAIYAKTGLVTYSGPNFNQFWIGSQLDYTYNYFVRCLVDQDAYTIEPSPKWSDDRFSPQHPQLDWRVNEGPWVIRPGTGRGTIIGGNLCTLNLLHGTPYMPSLRGALLCIEDDHESPARTFDRNLQSLLHLPDASEISGLVIGRFQGASGMTRAAMEHIIATKAELRNIPVIANVDFGHTYPMCTFPIGGTGEVTAADDAAKIRITEH